MYMYISSFICLCLCAIMCIFCMCACAYVYVFVILQIKIRHFSIFALSRIEHENLNIDSPRSCDSCLNLQAKIYSLSINIFFIVERHCGALR